MGCCNSLFSLQVGKDKIIDVNASFSPRSWPIRIFKFLCVSATITAVVLFLRLLLQKDDDAEKLEFVYYYMAYFTVWGLIISALYFLTSWVNSCAPLQQANNAVQRPTLRTKWTWTVFEVAAHTEIMVTILYWTLVHDKTDFPLWHVGNLLAHGGVMVLVLLSGLVVNRVPVRLSHYIFPFLVDLVYILWTLVHDRLSLFENDEDPGGDVGIYDVIDWTGNFQSTARLCALLLFVISPAVWIVLWLLSLCGRRTITVGQDDYRSVAHANEQVGRKKRQQRGRWGSYV